MTGVCRIPLWAQDGSIRAYTLVDEADFDTLNAYRWHLNSNGYAVRGAPKGKKLLMHREILGLTFGDGLEADHENPGQKLDNRRSNLRVATRGQNAQNLPQRARSVVRGVSWDGYTGRWRVRVRVGGKLAYNARFQTLEEASRAAVAARLRLMPFATN